MCTLIIKELRNKSRRSNPLGSSVWKEQWACIIVAVAQEWPAPGSCCRLQKRGVRPFKVLKYCCAGDHQGWRVRVVRQPCQKWVVRGEGESSAIVLTFKLTNLNRLVHLEHRHSGHHRERGSYPWGGNRWHLKLELDPPRPPCHIPLANGLVVDGGAAAWDQQQVANFFKACK